LVGRDPSNVDMKAGGDQIEYEDEDPAIRLEFDRELAKNGVKSAMPASGESR